MHPKDKIENRHGTRKRNNICDSNPVGFVEPQRAEKRRPKIVAHIVSVALPFSLSLSLTHQHAPKTPSLLLPTSQAATWLTLSFSGPLSRTSVITLHV